MLKWFKNLGKKDIETNKVDDAEEIFEEEINQDIID